MHLKEGYRLHTGKYRLLNVIGEGGFSLTYKGVWNTEIHGPLGKIPTKAPVCVKEYFFKDYCLRNEKTNFVETNTANGKFIFDKYKEKIIKEARILSEIHHPNVVKVLEVFKQNNTVYTVMEFISGDSLKKMLEQSGAFKEEQLLPIIYKIGRALHYIHEKNILHLDVKPSNILMDENDNPKLIDFGISKRYGLDDQQETSTSILAASRGYASIEQYDSEGMHTFSPCPDVYSLGATLYFLLTGEVPTESILRSTKGLRNPRELNPEISENTERVILKAMELHASDRYQSVIEMITDLGYNPETDNVQLMEAAGKDDDRTELLTDLKQSMNNPYDVDDETQIYEEEEKKRKKKKERGLLLSVALIVLAVSSLFLFFNNHISGNDDSRSTSGKDTLSNQIPYSDADDPDIVQSDTTTVDMRQDPNPKTTTTEEIPTKPDTNKEQYDRYFATALSSFNAKDYAKAKADFQQAASFKNSPEVNSFIDRCDNELEEQEIENRKILYEFKMKFGTFVVVRKKSDENMGAVDDKCIEKIPCMYIHSEIAGENRAFLRHDELWDVYSPSGKKVKEGVDSY